MSVERKWSFRIQHILDAIERIESYTEGMTEEAFRASNITTDAVIRNFQIIGEAVGRVPHDAKAAYPDIPWRTMQGMRHILVHDYDVVRVDVIWRTIQENLPPLKEPLRRILEEAEE